MDDTVALSEALLVTRPICARTVLASALSARERPGRGSRPPPPMTNVALAVASASASASCRRTARTSSGSVWCAAVTAASRREAAAVAPSSPKPTAPSRIATPARRRRPGVVDRRNGAGRSRRPSLSWRGSTTVTTAPSWPPRSIPRSTPDAAAPWLANPMTAAGVKVLGEGTSFVREAVRCEPDRVQASLHHRREDEHRDQHADNRQLSDRGTAARVRGDLEPEIDGEQPCDELPPGHAPVGIALGALDPPRSAPHRHEVRHAHEAADGHRDQR